MAVFSSEFSLIVYLVIASYSLSFITSKCGYKWKLNSAANLKMSSADSGFDGKEFEEALRNLSPAMGKKSDNADEIINDLRKEQISRKYPFGDYTDLLPMLPDCNNYYSGKFGDYTWHQNADQVFVYMPIDDSITKRDIEIKFEALYVDITVNDERLVRFDTVERLIPDGSFWILETDKDGQKYLQLDLEKRYRMINWKNLFGEAPKVVEGEAEERRKMLESLFSANKGMSKMTGKEPESMDEMMKNKELMKMIKEVNQNPEFLESLDSYEEGMDTMQMGEIEDDGEEDNGEGPVVEIDSPFDVRKFVSKTADKLYGDNNVVDTDSEVIDTTAEDPK
jgi:tellurite resistance protein